MSLVVLRSWTDGPPKVRAIAPPDDDRAVYVPDLHGRFLTEEIVVEVDGGHHCANNVQKEIKKTLHCSPAISNGSVSDGDSSQCKDTDQDKNSVVLRRDPKNKSHNRAQKSLSLFSSSSSSRRSFNVPENLVIRPSSSTVSSPSPENDGGSSIEYTPPASPVNGRYRNLGPELAATIPKRTIKSSWIAGIKSRRNTSTSTTHPHHHLRLSGSTLKSYSSSPTLAIETATDPTVDEEEAGDYFSYDQQEDSIFRRLYGNNSRRSYRTTTTDEDSQSDRSRSSLSLPYSSQSPSPPLLSLPLTTTTTTTATSATNPKGVSATNNTNLTSTSLRQQILSHSSKPNGLLSCHHNPNSLTTDFGNYSEDEVFDRCGGSEGSSFGSFLSNGNSNNNSDVVLVEVIRKKTHDDQEKSDDSGCNSSEGGGSGRGINNKSKVNVAERAKRFSIGETDENIPRKFAGVKVEGSPGKVARLKESLKRFGRFGRNQSERIIRNPQKEFEDDIENKDLCPENKDTAENTKTNSTITVSTTTNGNIHREENKKYVNGVKEEECGEIAIIKTRKSNSVPGSTERENILNNSVKDKEIKQEQQEEEPTSKKKNESSSNLSDHPSVIATTTSPSLIEKETVSNDQADSSKIPKEYISNRNVVLVKPPSSSELLDTLKSTSCNQSGQSGESEQKEDKLEENHQKEQQTHQEQAVHQIDTEINTGSTHSRNQDQEPKIKIRIEQVSNDDGNVVVHPDEEDDSSSSIVCQDRSMSLQMQSMPTIDLTLRTSSTQINNENIADIEERVIETLEKESLTASVNDIPPSPIASDNIITTNNTVSRKFIHSSQDDDQNQNDFVPVKVMHRMMNGQMPHGRKTNNSNGSANNSNSNSLDSNSHDTYGDVNGNGISYAFSSSSCSSSIGDESPTHFNHADGNSKQSLGRKIINGRNGNIGAVSVHVPVQAVNRHVMGYGLNIVDATNDAITTRSVSSTPPSENTLEADWHRSSLRDSFKGFCEDLLQDKINSLAKVPQVIEANGENEAVINFNEEDTSSIDPDEERENSVEYISISDIKVNNEKKAGKQPTKPDEFLPNYVIALDLGSSSSGYSYWTKEDADFVRIGNVNGGRTCPTSHKIPSWVAIDDLYLDVEDEEENSSLNSTPTFGHEAFDKYLSEDARGQLCHKWRAQFHDSSSYPYTLDSKSSDEDLVFTMKSAIRHYGKLAWEQIGQRKKGATVILVSIPSNYTHRARQLIREAAFGTGLVTQQDTLALIEDPCAAGLYAFHALKSKLAVGGNMNSGATTYLAVDIGGFYIHTSGYRISWGDGKLHQVCFPKSDPIIDSPESLFEAELSSVFTPSYMFNYQNKYRAGWLKLLTEFERVKNRFDPMPKQKYYVFVPSSFVDHFRRFTSMEIEDALESSDIVWNKSGALGIPHWKMVRFIQPMMDFVKEKIASLVKQYNFQHLVLTGGRAGSKVFVDSIKHYLRDYSIVVHVPKEHTASVLQGATLSVTNLSPRLVIKSPFSIGVGVMTPFIKNEHPEEKRVHRDGKSWCADVWDALIKVDQELELNKVILKRSYVGAQPGQSVLVLPLFKSKNDPKFVTESSVQKCCELKFNSDLRSWQEVELVIRCRPSELLITAMDGGVMKNYVVVDFLE